MAAKMTLTTTTALDLERTSDAIPLAPSAARRSRCSRLAMGAALRSSSLLQTPGSRALTGINRHQLRQIEAHGYARGGGG